MAHLRVKTHLQLEPFHPRDKSVDGCTRRKEYTRSMLTLAVLMEVSVELPLLFVGTMMEGTLGL